MVENRSFIACIGPEVPDVTRLRFGGRRKGFRINKSRTCLGEEHVPLNGVRLSGGLSPFRASRTERLALEVFPALFGPARRKPRALSSN
jgi:hypothetical protein